MKSNHIALAIEHIEKKIYVIRGHRVMFDNDLAMIYNVETRVLNQAVKRNINRFPNDFMFQLTKEEFNNLKSQTVTSSWGGRRSLPYAFTEHGAVMLASVLNSKVALDSSIYVVRAFIKLKEVLSVNKELSKRIDQLEEKYDAQFKGVFEAIRELMKPMGSLTTTKRGVKD